MRKLLAEPGTGPFLGGHFTREIFAHLSVHSSDCCVFLLVFVQEATADVSCASYWRTRFARLFSTRRLSYSMKYRFRFGKSDGYRC